MRNIRYRSLRVPLPACRQQDAGMLAVYKKNSGRVGHIRSNGSTSHKGFGKTQYNHQEKNG